MRMLKSRANENGAELLLVWVSASCEVCYERMKKRNSERDVLKLLNWEDYIKNINFTPPAELEADGAIDKLIIFDANDDMALKKSLKETLSIVTGE